MLLEMTMGMGFPGQWEWEYDSKLGMGRGGNEHRYEREWHLFPWDKILVDLVLFRCNWHYIFKDDCGAVFVRFSMFCDLFLEFLFFNDWCPVFCGTFTLYCFAVRVWKWELPNGNHMGMGIKLKLGNGNGKEWEMTVWDVKTHSQSSLHVSIYVIAYHWH